MTKLLTQAFEEDYVFKEQISIVCKNNLKRNRKCNGWPVDLVLKCI